MEKKILYKIEIEGNEELLQKMSELRRENDILKQSNKEYNQSLKEGKTVSADSAREFERNVVQIKSNNKQINELTKSVQNNGNVSKNLRSQLRELRQEMQFMALAGEDNTERYKELRTQAASYQEAIDGVMDEIKTFADGERIFTTVAEGAQVLGDAFTMVTGAQALLGFESEKFEETMQKLVGVMAITNSLQSLANNLKKESAVRTAIAAGATKIATAAQWAWNAAMNANPIILIVTGVAALTAGIIALVKNFDKVTNAFRNFGQWIGIIKDDTDEATFSTDNYRKSLENLNKESSKLVTSIQKEIDRLEAKGVSIDEIKQKERELIEAEIKNAEIRMQLAGQEAYSLDLTTEEREKKLEELKKEEKAYDDLWHQLEIFDINERKRTKEQRERESQTAQKRSEEREKELEEIQKVEDEKARLQKEWLQREELASAQLELLLNKNVDNAIALAEVEYKQKIESKEWTDAELELMEVQHQENLKEIRAEYAELKKEEDEIVISEEEQKRLDERNRFLAELEQRRQDELSDFQLRKEQLDLWLSEKVISEQEYSEEVKKLNEDIASHEANLALMRIKTNFDLTKGLIDNLQKAGLAESKAAKFNQLLAIAEAFYNISVGISKTASVGFPQNIPLLLGFASQTAGIIAGIKNLASPKPPKLAKGGRITIGGKSHSEGGTKFYGEDGSIFEAEKNEELFIINKYDSKTIDLLSSINSKNGVSFSNTPTNYFANGGRFTPRQDFDKFNMSDMIREVVDEISHIPVIVSEKDITSTQSKVRKLKVAGNL